ncbi:hypothetical protein PHSY_003356 [Pseudozyma hubeiensis SY62]|uniref:Uncharacterized protein n=1 Tax=Pseudozyma hubeiensis (strain SY62) TaxID=1305764 RepID=R9PCI6_PSEHS|nr:hypothetical protein PHSY_003356 [Pseudozyma hubeiensis SY62]GAC95780.1 hypothetical protein PHSY_003356 [Pseudozyma hubeiensis SY62]
MASVVKGSHSPKTKIGKNQKQFRILFSFPPYFAVDILRNLGRKVAFANRARLDLIIEDEMGSTPFSSANQSLQHGHACREMISQTEKRLSNRQIYRISGSVGR